MMQTATGTAASGQTMSRRLLKAALAAMVAMVCACAFTLVTTNDQAEAATALSAKKVSSTGTWTTKDCKTYYKVGGKAVTGFVTIGSHSYYFDSKGVERDGWRKIGYSYYYFRHTQGKDGYMRADCVVNGIKLGTRGEAQLTNTTQVSEIGMYVKSQKIMDSIVKPGRSTETKLKAAFKWVNGWRINERVVHGWTSKSGWHRLFANDILANHTGDCYSMGCAMAYLGNAIGCSSVECISSGGHGWARINGKIYDPEYSPLGTYLAYGLNESYHPSVPVNYKDNAIYVVKLTRTSLWTGTKLSSSSSVKNGIVKSGGKYYLYRNGARLYSTWAKHNGYTYYLTSTGAAATYAKKIGDYYYVFGLDGKLRKGDTTRITTVGKYYYRVTKNGAASPGWSYYTPKGSNAKEKCYLYLKTGRRAPGGITVYGGKMVFLTADKGVYAPERTKKLQAVSKVAQIEESGGTLLEPAETYAIGPLLDVMKSLEGAPNSVYEAESCIQINDHYGTDLIYTFDHCKISTFRADDESFEVITYLEAC